MLSLEVGFWLFMGAESVSEGRVQTQSGKIQQRWLGNKDVMVLPPALCVLSTS